MKKLYAVLLFLSFTIHGCSNSKKMSIEGETSAGFDNAVVIISKNGKEFMSSNVAENRFTLSGVIPGPDFYDLEFHPNNEKSDPKSFLIYLDGQNCNISYQSRGPDYYPAIKSDSKDQNELTRFYNKYELRKKDLEIKGGVYKQRVDSLQQVFGHVEEYNEALKASSELIIASGNMWSWSIENYIQNNPSSQLSAYFVSLMEEEIEYDPRKYEKIYLSFSDEIKESHHGTLIRKNIDKYMHGASGTKIPDILGTDLHGKELNMASLKGKISLVFFWLSSNKDSKNDIDALKDIYAKYHSKGFEIVAICFDKRKDRWEKYISENNLPWINLFDENGLASANFKNFGNSNIPYNFLIGPDLVISERNVPLEQFDLYFKTLKK